MSQRKKPWIKLWRKTLQNDWLNEQPEYGWAWIQILMAAEDGDGKVDLTEIPARDHFHPSAWRRYITRLEEEGMLESVETVNLGGRRGRRVFATIANWAYYQGSKNGLANDGANDGTNDGANELATPAPAQAKPATSDGTNDGANELASDSSKRRSLYIFPEGLDDPQRGDARAREAEPPDQPTPPPPEKPKPQNPNAYSAEERCDAVMRGRPDPHSQQLQARTFFERTCGKDFASAYVADLARWYAEHGEDKLRRYWETSRVEYWQGTERATKRRSWNMADLCQGEILPPDQTTPQERQKSLVDFPPGTLVHHPTWGKGTVRGHFAGELHLSHGCVVPPEEVTLCTS